MLTIAQKQAVYTAMKTAYTVDGKSFTASVIYANQTISSYPTITLHYGEEEQKDQNLDGEARQRSLAWLSLNVYAQSAQAKNAYTIAHDIARQLRTDIRQNWGGIATGLKYKRMSQARDLSMLEIGEGIQISRVQFDVFLTYDVTW